MCKRIVQLSIIGLLLIILLLVGLWVYLRPAPNQNELALGEASPISTPLTIPIHPPQELDGLTRQAVYNLRTQAVNQYPDLLAQPYQPDEGVFGAIQDGSPWWGTIGEFYYGSGDLSIEGNSEEARFILNPYLLVAAEFLGMSIYGGGDWQWDEARIDTENLRAEDYPLYCVPQDLIWQPQTRQASVTYDVTTCLANINRWRMNPLTPTNWWFDLVAYNARDLNLNYLYVVYSESIGLVKAEAPTEAIQIPHYIHRGGSCGYAGGCNNMSPSVPETDFILFTTLPAQMVIWLWSDRPASPPRQPDLIYTIQFK